MLIKMTYRQLGSEEFIRALTRLSSIPMPLSNKIAYTIKKINDELKVVKNRIFQEYQSELIKKYAVKDESGMPAPSKSVDGFDVIPEMKEEFHKAEEELLSREVTLTRDMMSLKAMMQISPNLSLSAMEISALAPIIMDDLEMPEVETLQATA